MSQDARVDEELSTQRRGRILGIDYLDVTKLPEKPLFKDVLPLQDLRQLRVVPIRADQSNILFGITTTTSQVTMTNLRQRFSDQRVAYTLISEAGFRDYMHLYDPPKKI